MVGKDKRETTEGTFFDYSVKYFSAGQTNISDISLGIDDDREYDVNETIKLRVNQENPKMVESLSNLGGLRFKFIMSILLVLIFLYTTISLTFFFARDPVWDIDNPN